MMVERVCRAVEAVIRERGLLHPVELLESMADVFFVPLSGARARGASFVVDLTDRPVVVIDAGLSGLPMWAVATHEGAHLVLHYPWANRVFMQASTLALPDRYEAEADVFALAYLLRWDPGLPEQFGWDAGRLAKACGLPGAVPYAGEAAARILGRLPSEELWTP